MKEDAARAAKVKAAKEGGSGDEKRRRKKGSARASASKVKDEV